MNRTITYTSSSQYSPIGIDELGEIVDDARLLQKEGHGRANSVRVTINKERTNGISGTIKKVELSGWR